jgi:uncharacterized protein (TIGR00297 family)
LSFGGAVGAVGVGTLCVAAGWDWGALLIAFFVTSTALSRIGKDAKAARTGSVVEKGGARDATQVLANGGLFVASAAGFLIAPAPGWQAFGAGALAASTADTWATELGTLVGTSPRSILTFRPVAPGTSGGVTTPGTLAAVAGALFLGGMAGLVGWSARVAGGAILGGLVGSTADSILGATVQARRWCPGCDTATERNVHSCGTPTVAAGGLAWLTNDGVNMASAAIGAAASLWIWTLKS